MEKKNDALRLASMLQPMRAGFAAVALAAFSMGSHAALSVVSVTGGAPTGVSYANFDNIALGTASGSSGGLMVSFSDGAKAVQGALTSQYAEPFLSNSNGAVFGDPTISGLDTTTYLATTLAAGTATLTLPTPALYFGLLWGSVDATNKLTFYDASNQIVGSLTGMDVSSSANGNQGAAGTFYVNITSTTPFTKVVASGKQFELDNVAYNPTIPAAVPEPGSAALMGLGIMLGVGWLRRSSRRR